MAKILFGAGVGDARGSVGSATFTKGRNGAVLRTKVSPVQPRSPNVMAIRAFFQTLSKNWANTLTDAERAGWNALAAVTSYVNSFGNTYHPTGLQLYQGCNRNLQLLGAPLISAAPDNLDVDTPLTLTVTADSDPQTLSAAYTATPVPADHSICFDMTPQVNRGRSFMGSNFKFINSYGPATASPADLLSLYTAKFGALRAGQKLTTRCWLINQVNGAASQEITAVSTVL